MKKILLEIKLSFGNAQSLYRLMVINIAVFLVFMLLRTIFYLFQVNSGFVGLAAMNLSLPSELSSILTQPWSLITYMFFHQEFFHILFNMLVLYWLGKIFTEYLGNDKLWATYILGGLSGAFLYVLAYNIFPAFAMDSGARLMGASAGVIAVMVATATLIPDYTIMLLFFGQVKLKFIAIFSILLYAINIPQGNAGGNIAHIGGALFGFIMIKQLQKGNDMTAWLIKLFSAKGKPRMKVTSRNRTNNSDAAYHSSMRERQEIIDGILDKISQSGYSSLSAEEKEILFKASKNIHKD